MPARVHAIVPVPADPENSVAVCAGSHEFLVRDKKTAHGILTFTAAGAMKSATDLGGLLRAINASVAKEKRALGDGYTEFRLLGDPTLVLARSPPK